MNDDMDNVILVSFMRRELLQQICDILDTDDLWETIAPSMPGIELRDVEGCRRYSKSNKSATQLLLRIWTGKGYTVNHLYQLFAKTRMVRCMNIIKEIVDEKYYYLENRVQHQHRKISSAVPATSSKASQPKKTVDSRSASNNQTSSSSKSKITDPIRIAIEGTLTVSYAELQVATNDFSSSNVIGRGGYGVVYRGELRTTGGSVAVKRIMSGNDRSEKVERERLRQSLQELKTLARFRHDNILPIYAYSLEGPEPCLVYQFMANGSLEDRLLCRKGSSPLTWVQKQEIGLGAARGLLFLHTFAKTPIIHGDVKTANILLDKHMEPKLGDFGLSRDGQVEFEAAEKCPLIASHIKGTLAYLPPEFITSKILSTKLDVYSFGIVLLEIVTGLRVYNDSREPCNLVEYCRSRKEDAVRRNVDIKDILSDKRTPTISPEMENEIFSIFLHIGLAASRKDWQTRPSMEKIVEMIAKSSLNGFDE